MIPGSRHAVQTYKRIRDWAERHERWFMPTMLVFGALFDVIQFRMLNLKQTFFIIVVYIILVVGSMALSASGSGRKHRFLRYLHIIAPLAQQFALGGMLSTALLFYWFSGEIAVTWPLIGLIVIIMISNETFRHVFLRPVVQVGVFYFSLFSLFSIWFAHLFQSLSWIIFLTGGFVSLGVMTGILALLVRVGDLFEDRMKMWFTIAGIFACMNVFYVLDIIPPIPLALREAEMAYSIREDYSLVAPTESWLESLWPGQTILVRPGNALYAATAIYAPDGLSATIVHIWQRYNEETKHWDDVHELSFGILGGRPDGYRGYSMVSSLAEGEWRVNVQTLSGQTLGRLRFTVENGE